MISPPPSFIVNGVTNIHFDAYACIYYNCASYHIYTHYDRLVFESIIYIMTNIGKFYHDLTYLADLDFIWSIKIHFKVLRINFWVP